MGILAERALRRVHTGVARRNYRLTIGDVPYSDQVRNISGQFDPKGGGSALTISVRDSLEGLEDAPVALDLGYGDILQPYFRGILAEPGSLAGGKAVAYGPFKAMADQQLGEEVRYQGVPLHFVFKDLESRAGFNIGFLDVIEGKEIVEDSLYTEETAFSEVAKQLADKNNYVFYDRPGVGRRLMPTPKTGMGGRPKAHYAESNYQSFSVTESRTSHFSRVIVARRDSAGGYAVRATAEVATRGKFKPPANRIHYTMDFPGTPQAAQQQAYEIANRLSYGEYTFSLDGIWINPELESWDAITVEAVERKPRHASPTGKPGKFLVTYMCLLNNGLSFQVARDQHYMNITGDAVRAGFQKLPDPIRVNTYRLSPGTVLPRDIPGLKPRTGLKPRAGLKPRSTRFSFPDTGILRIVELGGLKPNVGQKPNIGLKPRRSRSSFSETYQPTRFPLLSAADSHGVGTDGPTYPPPHGPYVYVDESLWVDRWFQDGVYYVDVSLFQWNTAAVPDALTPISAHLIFTPYSQIKNVDNRSITADWYTFGTAGAEDHSQTALTTANAGIPIAAMSLDTPVTMPLLAPAANISKIGLTGLRLHCSGGQPTGANGIYIAGHGHPTLDPPTLVVEYAR